MELTFQLREQPKSIYRDTNREIHLYKDKSGCNEINYGVNYGNSIFVSGEEYFVRDIVLFCEKGTWKCKCFLDEGE